MKFAPIVGATLVALAGSPAHALETFKTYDNFTAATIDPDLWSDGERTRIVKKGQLNLIQRSYGLATTNAGLNFYSFNTNMADPAAVNELRAKVTVNALEVNACTSNTSLGQSRARILGAFFNAATPVTGDQTNDVLAQVRMTRFSNSTDAAGVLRVQGTLVLCTNADCSTSTNIGSTVDLGTVAVGTPATLQLQWDKPNKRFLFSRDSGAFSGATPYTQSDAQPAGVPLAQMSTRLDVPNCLSGPRVTGQVDASYDSVSVNKSAAP